MIKGQLLLLAFSLLWIACIGFIGPLKPFFHNKNKFGKVKSHKPPTVERISRPKIKLVGVGGGGGNAVHRMLQAEIANIEFVSMNTDMQALAKFINLHSKCQTLNIGSELTKGLGAGGNPENGRKAAEESREDIQKIVKDTDLVFITAGMGGGTGSGAAPVIAEIAREMGALTVGIVTKPFAFEGKRRMQQALTAIENLRAVVDTLIVLSNDRLLKIIPESTPIQKAFSMADDVLRQGVVGISDIINKPGLINVDFADVKAIMSEAGTALMGIGSSTGKNRAADAAVQALASPLLDIPIAKARGVVFNIVGGNDLTLQEVNEAAKVIYEAVDPNANIIFGASINDTMQQGQITITVIATGFPAEHLQQHSSPSLTTTGLRHSISNSGSETLRLARDDDRIIQDTNILQSNTINNNINNNIKSKNQVPNSKDGSFAAFMQMLKRKE